MLFARIFITPLLPEFLARNPDLQLHMVLGGCERTPDESNLDIVIQTGSCCAPDMSILSLGRIDHVLCASPSYLQKHGDPGSPDDLQEHSCLTLRESGPQTIWKLTNGEESVEISLSPRTSANDSEILHALVLQGVGIAKIPRWMATPHLRNGTLQYVLPGWQPEAVDIHMVYPARLNPAPGVCAFLQLLVEQLDLDRAVECRHNVAA